jgi:hypothetical protein
MLSAWAFLFYIATSLLCARLLRLRHYGWRVRIITGGVVLYSLFQLGGLGGWLPGPVSDSYFGIGTLCVVLIFLMGEAALGTRIEALEPRVSEGPIRSSHKLNSEECPATQPGAQLGPSDPRGGARRSIRVAARVQLISNPRVIVKGVIDNISVTGMRLRLTDPLPLSSSIRVDVLSDTLFGIVRYCDAAPDYLEYYAGIELDHHLDPAALEKIATWHGSLP